MQQGAYANYPRPNQRQIRFDVIAEAWTIVSQNWGPVLAVGGLALVISMALYAGLFGVMVAMMGPSMFDPNAATSTDTMASLMAQLQIQGLSIVATPIIFGVLGPVYASMIHMGLKAASGDRLEVNDAFFGFTKFVPTAIASAITGVLFSLGSMCCYIPGFILYGLTMASLPLILDRGLGPIEAIGQSFALMKSHVWMAALLAFVLLMLSGLGACACIVGILVTMPLAYIAQALVYRDLTAPDFPPAQNPWENPPAAPVG